MDRDAEIRIRNAGPKLRTGEAPFTGLWIRKPRSIAAPSKRSHGSRVAHEHRDAPYGLMADMKALRAIAGGLREADLRVASRRVADYVEAGVPFSDALARFSEFPATFRPLVEWGERQRTLADAMRGATDMCEARLRFQSLFVEAAILPILRASCITVAITGFAVFLPRTTSRSRITFAGEKKCMPST